MKCGEIRKLIAKDKLKSITKANWNRGIKIKLLNKSYAKNNFNRNNTESRPGGEFF